MANAVRKKSCEILSTEFGFSGDAASMACSVIKAGGHASSRSLSGVVI
jgi:hypothetical protein